MPVLSHHQAVRLARRIAFRVLVADITDKVTMDQLIRVAILEGAAGVGWGSWSRPMPARGLQKAQAAFPGADPRWFDKRDTRFFHSLLSAVRKRMGGYDEDTVDDVLMMIVGEPKYFAKLGKKFAKDIAAGGRGYDNALKGMFVIGKSRAADYIRDLGLEQEQGLAVGEEGELLDLEQGSMALPSSKEQTLSDVDAMEDLIISDRRLMAVAREIIGRMKDGKRKQVMEAWLADPSLTNREIAAQVGVSGAYVGQTKKVLFVGDRGSVKDKAERYLDTMMSRYAKAQEIAARWLEQKE
jgi:hypothetical protein